MRWLNRLNTTTATTATKMPRAVAISASEMWPETTPMPASWPLVSARCRSRKASMMPTTVPNRPTNGAVAPIVPGIHSRDLSPVAMRTRSRCTALATFSGLERPRRS